MKKFVYVFNVDDYADNGGGWQEPVVIDAASRDEVVALALEHAATRGYYRKKDLENRISQLVIYDVNEIYEFNVEGLNREIARNKAEKAAAEKKEKDAKLLKRLVEDYPDLLGTWSVYKDKFGDK